MTGTPGRWFSMTTSAQARFVALSARSVSGGKLLRTSGRSVAGADIGGYDYGLSGLFLSDALWLGG